MSIDEHNKQLKNYCHWDRLPKAVRVVYRGELIITNDRTLVEKALRETIGR